MKTYEYGYTVFNGDIDCIEMLIESFNLDYNTIDIIHINFDSDKHETTIIYKKSFVKRTKRTTKKSTEQSKLLNLLKKARNIIYKNEMTSTEKGCTYFDAVELIKEIDTIVK